MQTAASRSRWKASTGHSAVNYKRTPEEQEPERAARLAASCHSGLTDPGEGLADVATLKEHADGSRKRKGSVVENLLDGLFTSLTVLRTL